MRGITESNNNGSPTSSDAHPMNDYKANPNSSKTCPDIDYHQELVGACLFCRWLPSDEQIKRLQGTGTQPTVHEQSNVHNKDPKIVHEEAKPAHEHESQLLPCKCGAWWNGESWGEATALSPDYFQRELKDAKEIKKLVDKVAGKTGKHTQHCWDRSDTYCICPVSTRLEDTTALSDHQDNELSIVESLNLFLAAHGHLRCEKGCPSIDNDADRIEQLISHCIVEELEALLPQGVSFLNKRIIQRRIKEIEGELSE